MLENSPAGLDGSLKTGDRILAVNDVDLTQASHDRAVDVIRHSASPVKFLIQSLLSCSLAAMSSQQQLETDTQLSPPPPPPPAQELSLEEEPAEISTDALDDNAYGYTAESVRDKYAHLLESSPAAECRLCVFKLRRERVDESLGLSLSGNVNLHKTSVFVCGIYADSIAQRHGRLRVGDQILEINGQGLCGRAHSNVTPLIRNLKELDVYVVVLRNEDNLQQMCKPKQHHQMSGSNGSSQSPPSSPNNEPAHAIQPPDAVNTMNAAETTVSASLEEENPVRRLVISKGPTGFGIAISEDKYRRLIVRGLNPNGVAFSVSLPQLSHSLSLSLYLPLFAVISVCFERVSQGDK